VPLALREAKFFTGIDWAAENHAVCVMNTEGKIAAQFTIAHTADGIALLIRRLARFGDPAGMQVAIERPNGRLVDLLLEAGHPVVPVKPNAIKAWRDGEVLSGAKSDAGDAAVIAEYLRLRQHKLTVAVPYSGQTRALRTVVRTRGDLVQTRVATANQLTALLEDCWPGAAVIFADIASRSRWHSWPVTQPRPQRLTSARSGLPRSAPATITPAAAPPPSCWNASAPPRPGPPIRPSPWDWPTPSWPWQPS
jgi:hypothetical protein